MLSSLMVKYVLNLILAYGGWIAGIYTAAHGMSYIGVCTIVLILCIHFRFTKNFTADMLLMISMGVLGTLIDSSYILGSLIHYQGGYLEWVAPLWITSLWALFSISFNHSLMWLEKHPVLTSILGAVGAPSTYLAATKVGAAEFTAPEYLCLIVVGAVWAIVFPALFAYSRWLRLHFAG